MNLNLEETHPLSHHRKTVSMNKINRDTNRVKKPWPTKDAMAQIYDKSFWGGENADFYSGIGSHDSNLVGPYIKAVASFLTSFDNPLVICDLGCGDFNVGKELVKYTEKYIAVDIVPDLTTRNRETFKDEKVEFHCLDIAKDQLPDGDCAIVRHVLQHLSNDEIKRIARKLTKYQYLILTEHIPGKDFKPNKDIISGQGIRLKKQSGVDLLSHPFNMKIKEEKHLLTVASDAFKGEMVTTLYKLF